MSGPLVVVLVLLGACFVALVGLVAGVHWPERKPRNPNPFRWRAHFCQRRSVKP